MTLSSVGGWPVVALVSVSATLGLVAVIAHRIWGTASRTGRYWEWCLGTLVVAALGFLVSSFHEDAQGLSVLGSAAIVFSSGALWLGCRSVHARETMLGLVCVVIFAATVAALQELPRFPYSVSIGQVSVGGAVVLFSILGSAECLHKGQERSIQGHIFASALFVVAAGAAVEIVDTILASMNMTVSKLECLVGIAFGSLVIPIVVLCMMRFLNSEWTYPSRTSEIHSVVFDVQVFERVTREMNNNEHSTLSIAVADLSSGRQHILVAVKALPAQFGSEAVIGVVSSSRVAVVSHHTPPAAAWLLRQALARLDIPSRINAQTYSAASLQDIVRPRSSE